MHCQISIFELKMMVKIGVIFKSYMPSLRYELTWPPKGLLLVSWLQMVDGMYDLKVA